MCHKTAKPTTLESSMQESTSRGHCEGSGPWHLHAGVVGIACQKCPKSRCSVICGGVLLSPEPCAELDRDVEIGKGCSGPCCFCVTQGVMDFSPVSKGNDSATQFCNFLNEKLLGKDQL